MDLELQLIPIATLLHHPGEQDGESDDAVLGEVGIALGEEGNIRRPDEVLYRDTGLGITPLSRTLIDLGDQPTEGHLPSLSYSR